MPKNKALPTSRPESIEEAWDRGDELAMARAVVRKFCRVLDMTDSGRDVKPLATGLYEALARVHEAETRTDYDDTPLARIMRKAAEQDREGAKALLRNSA